MKYVFEFLITCRPDAPSPDHYAIRDFDIIGVKPQEPDFKLFTSWTWNVTKDVSSDEEAMQIVADMMEYHESLYEKGLIRGAVVNAYVVALQIKRRIKDMSECRSNYTKLGIETGFVEEYVKSEDGYYIITFNAETMDDVLGVLRGVIQDCMKYEGTEEEVVEMIAGDDSTVKSTFESVCEELGYKK